jgi:hypothetical protein
MFGPLAMTATNFVGIAREPVGLPSWRRTARDDRDG